MRRFNRSLALVSLLSGAAVLGWTPETHAFSLVNGGFEQPVNTNTCTGTPPWICYIPDVDVPGWNTTDTSTNNPIEIWRDTPSNGSIPLAYEGNQYAELNSFQAATLYQDIAGISAGQLVGYELAHRGRDGVDVMQLDIIDLGSDNAPGGVADTTLFSRQFSNGNTAWSFYSQGNVATTLGNSIRFAYTAVSSASTISNGNFLDAAAFGVGVGVNTVPAPLPILGAGAAFGFSRRLRRRIRRDA